MENLPADIYQYPQDQDGGDSTRIPFIQQNPELILQLLDTDRLLEQLENELLGRYWNELKHEFVQQYEPLLTKKGINWLMPYLRGHLTKLLPLTNYEKSEINALMTEIVDTIVNTFCSEYGLFFPQDSGIKKYSHIRSALDKTEHTINAVYNRALGNKERLMLMTVAKENRTVTEYKDNQKNTSASPFSVLPFKE